MYDPTLALYYNNHTMILMANNGVSDGGGGIYICLLEEKSLGRVIPWLMMICLRSSKLLTYSAHYSHG